MIRSATAPLPTSTSTPPAPSAPGPARAFHAGTLLLGAVVLALLARGQWFFGDEWDPIAQRSVFGPAEKGLLEPHNEHWSTIAVLVYRAHLAVFGLRTYVPLMVLFIAVCVVTAHLLWRLCVRVGSDPYVAALLALAFLLFGPAASEVVFAWNFTFVGALGCGVGILVLVRDEGPMTSRDRWAAWGLGTLALLLSGVALTMLAVVGASLWWTRGPKVAAEALSVPIAVAVVWTLGWGPTGDSLLSLAGADRIPGEVRTGIGFAFDDFTRVPYAGAVVAVTLLAYAVGTWRSWTGTRAWALCSAAGAVVFYAIVAIRRNTPFLPGPTTGRYVWMAFALLLPLLGLAISAAVRRWRAAAVIGAIVAAVLLPIQVDHLADDARVARDLKAMERRRIVAAARLAERGLPMVEDSVLPNSVFEDSATVDLLTRLDRDGELPDVARTRADRLGARADLQVAWDHWPETAADAPARVIGLYDSAATPTADGCIAFAPTGPHPHIRFASDPTATTAARIDGEFPSGLAVAVVRRGVTGPWRPIVPFVRRPFRVRLAAADTDVLVATGEVPVTVCGVTVDPAIYTG